MLTYRNLQATDVHSIAEIYFPYIISSAISFETEVPDINQLESRLQNIAAKYPFIVLAENNTILGYAYGSTHRERAAYRWAVETSIYLAPNAIGKGFAKPLYLLLLEELIQRNFTHAFGIITLPNEKSVQLHTACGFENSCIHRAAGFKLGAWHDVKWMRRELATEALVPKEPEFRPFTNLT